MLFASCQIFLGGSNQEDEMGRTCGMYGAEDKCVQGCGEECEGKRPFVRHRQRWVDDIKMDRKEVEWKIGTVFIWLWSATSGRFL